MAVSIRKHFLEKLKSLNFPPPLSSHGFFKFIVAISSMSALEFLWCEKVTLFVFVAYKAIKNLSRQFFWSFSILSAVFWARVPGTTIWAPTNHCFFNSTGYGFASLYVSYKQFMFYISDYVSCFFCAILRCLWLHTILFQNKFSRLGWRTMICCENVMIVVYWTLLPDFFFTVRISEIEFYYLQWNLAAHCTCADT